MPLLKLHVTNVSVTIFWAAMSFTQTSDAQSPSTGKSLTSTCSKIPATFTMYCNRGYTPGEMMQMHPPEKRSKLVSVAPGIRNSIQTGEMDIEDFRKQILTMELPSETIRFDLLKQLTDIKPAAPQPEKQKKVGRNDPCPCGSGKKYKKCCGR